MAMQCKEHARIVANNIWNDLKGNDHRLDYKTRTLMFEIFLTLYFDWNYSYFSCS